MPIGYLKPILGRAVAERGQALDCVVDVGTGDDHVDVDDWLRGKARHRRAADVLHARWKLVERRLDSRAQAFELSHPLGVVVDHLDRLAQRRSLGGGASGYRVPAPAGTGEDASSFVRAASSSSGVPSCLALL